MAPDDQKPPYVQLRKGRWYWEPPLRLRRSHGLETVPLGADQGPAWAYARKLNKDRADLDPGAAVPGSVEWVFHQFFEGEKFAALAASTQADYRWLAKRLGAIPMGPTTVGRLSARAIKPRHADKLYLDLKKEAGHTTAHYACRFARRVWKWAARREMVDGAVNPWAEMELAGVAKRHQRWTEDQVRQVMAAAAKSGNPSIGLAVHIAYSFTHRQGDVLALTWAALDAQAVTTSKTGALSPVVAAAYPELLADLIAERERQATAGLLAEGDDLTVKPVVVCEGTGRAWRPDYFRHVFRAIANQAGLPPELQFRDLRATGLTEMADAGASIMDMSTHSTHSTMEMARRYSRKTPEQFERAAAVRIAGKRPKKPSDGTATD